MLDIFLSPALYPYKKISVSQSQCVLNESNFEETHCKIEKVKPVGMSSS